MRALPREEVTISKATSPLSEVNSDSFSVALGSPEPTDQGGVGSE